MIERRNVAARGGGTCEFVACGALGANRVIGTTGQLLNWWRQS
jgi:hypothetical protein